MQVHPFGTQHAFVYGMVLIPFNKNLVIGIPFNDNTAAYTTV
jgi:hypothetical protein